MRRAGPVGVELRWAAASALLRPHIRGGRDGRGRGYGAAAAAARLRGDLQPGVLQHLSRRRAPLRHILEHRLQEVRQQLRLIRQSNSNITKRKEL